MADGSRMVASEAATAALPSRAGRRRAAGRTARQAARRADWAEFVIDVWITDFNSVEFGIYKHSRNRAKSRQFTTDMDVFAEVTENGERTGVIGYREDAWRRSTGMDRRLVMKLFSETLSWRGSMELMVGRSLQQTLGARGLPVTSFAVNTSEDESMVYVERSANKWPLGPEDFSFFLFEGGEPRFYRLTRDIIDLGGDYTLYSQRNEPVGRIDGKVFSIGGKWRGRVHPDHACGRLLTVLKLFSAMLIFNPDCRRHLRRLARDVRRGRCQPKVEAQEADLYMNPRRMR